MTTVVYGYYGQMNTGDEVLLEAIVQNLRGMLPRALLDLSVLPARTTTAAYRPCGGSLPVRSYYPGLRRFGIYRGARCTDLLIVGGGGLIQDHEDVGAGGVRALLKRAALARLGGGRVVLLGIGASRLTTRHGRAIVRALGRLSDLVTTRDPSSAAALEQAGVAPHKIHPCADIAFAWDPQVPQRAPEDRARPDVLVSVLGYQHERRESPHTTHRIRTELATALRGLVDQTGAHLTFLTFHGAPFGSDFREAGVIARLLDRPGHCHIAPYRQNPGDTYARIIGADLLVGMRLHSLILAAKARVPFVGLAYHDKIFNVLDTMEASSLLLDRALIDSGTLLQMMMDGLAAGPRLVLSSLDDLHRQAQRNFTLLAERFGD